MAYHEAVKRKFKLIAGISGMIIVGLFLTRIVTYYNQPRYKICCSYWKSPDKPVELEGKCLKLNYSLEQVEAMYPRFCTYPPHTMEDSYGFAAPESATEVRSLSKNALNKIVNVIEHTGNRPISKVFYDYYAKEPGGPYSSSFFHFFSSNGTYYLRHYNNVYFEINDRDFTLIIQVQANGGGVYILNDKYAKLPMKELKKEHFVKLKNIGFDRQDIRLYSLPFGTYLMHYEDCDHYFIFSIYPD